MSLGAPLVALLALSAPPSTSTSSTSPRRVLGVLGESCRAALDCRPALRCEDHVCVARPQPKPDDAPLAEEPAKEDRPRSRLRLGIEVQGGAGGRAREETDLLDRRPPRTLDAATGLGVLAAVVELGLDDDQVTLGLGGGAAMTDRLEDPGGFVDLRAAWRVWRGSPSVGLWVEPRVESWLGGLPGGFGVGGSLALRFRMHEVNLGLRAGALTSGEGTRTVDDITPIRERVAIVHGGAFLGLLPELAAW
jgi:hypothetical protein